MEDDEWLSSYNETTTYKSAFITKGSDYDLFNEENNSLTLLDKDEQNNILIYTISKYNYIYKYGNKSAEYLDNFTIPCLRIDYSDDSNIITFRSVKVDGTLSITDISHVTHQIIMDESRGTLDIKDTVSDTTKNEFNDQGEKHIYGLNNGKVYQPFNLYEKISYPNGLYIKQNVYYHNLKCLDVYKELSIDTDKGLYVNDGDIVIQKDFVMNPRSTIQCKKLSF